ncbi:MAG: hypothetical protein GF307_05660 [candidate division Zixibacteria bacterium]|nr:hypothetical protein [candidate division Zixibacteria bacterium]
MKKIKETIDRETIKEIHSLIDKSERILITGHENPDGDSLGSQIAFGEYLKSKKKQFWILNQGEIPAKYKFADPEGYIKENPQGLNIKPDLVLVVECPNLDRIGWVRKYLVEGVPVINIDHHENNIGFGDINLVDTSQAAVGELVFDVLKLNGYTPGKVAANALYLAIYTDTGRFRHDSTTPEALRTSAELIEYGAEPRTVADNAYCSYSVSALRLLGIILSNIELFLDDRVCFLTITQEHLDSTNASSADLEGVIDYSLYVDGVDVGLLFKDFGGDSIRVSFRCREEYDILPLASKFGGGGHHHAAGCSVPGPLENARKLMIDALQEMLGD